MADKTISALTAASTPLAGTEVVPLVQSSTTKKVSIASMFGANVYTFLNTPTSANLAAAVTDETGTGKLVFATNPVFSNTGGAASANYTNSAFQDVLVNFYNASGTVGNKITFQFASNGGATTTNSLVSYGSSYGSGLNNAVELGNSNGKVRVTTAGDVAATTGNFIPFVAGKGVNFTANTPAAGVTSQLLNWYEEGTFTPTYTSDGTPPTCTYSIQDAKYTRIGNMVYFSIEIRTNTASGGTGSLGIAGLPFTSINSRYSGTTNVGFAYAFTTQCPTTGYIPANSTTLYLCFKTSATEISNVSAGYLTNAAASNYLLISGSYVV